MENNDELNVKAWRIAGFQTSRGFGARSGGGDIENDVIGLTLLFRDLDKPGYFIMAPHEAEQLGQALLDSARRATSNGD